MPSQPSTEDVRTQLEDRIAGQVLAPDEEGYREAVKVWNARFTSTPDLVVRCHRARDVQAAVDVARESGIPLTVKSGGHDYAGNSAAEGGILVDLGPMASVSVDAGARRVTVGPGARWRDVDGATQAEGLATPGGTVSHVGVAGFVLGGGQGWLSRKHGMAADNLLAAEVVTADGRRVRASAEENPDLFWALRGGGGNVGIVTSFELALHPVGPEVTGGQVMYPVDRAKELLGFFRDYFRDAPDGVMCFPFFLRIPPIPDFPEAMHGQLVLDFVLFHPESGEEAEAALAPFREQGEPLLELVGPTRYVDLQQGFDAGMGSGFRWYSRSHHFDDLTDAAIEDLVDALDPFPGDFTTVYLGPESGAASRVEEDATAYPHRTGGFSLHVFPGWSDPDQDEEVMAWARGVYGATSAHGNGRVYVNLLGEDEEGRLGEAYGSNLARLREVKAAWDPENLFRRNHNVAPTG